MILFRQHHLKKLFDETKQRAEASTRNINDYEIDNFSKEVIIQNTLKDYKIEHLEINLENRTSSVEMIPIPAEKFPGGYDVRRGGKYPLARVKYSYNKPKKYNLLEYLPNGMNFNKNVEFSTGSNNLFIYYQTLYANENLSDDVKREVKNFMIELHDDIRNIIENMNQQIDAFNIELQAVIEKEINARIEKKIQKENQNNDLNDF